MSEDDSGLPPGLEPTCGQLGGIFFGSIGFGLIVAAEVGVLYGVGVTALCWGYAFWYFHERTQT